MKVIDYTTTEPRIHKFELDIDGAKYTLTEHLDRNSYQVERVELVNEWGREIKDKTVYKVAQKIVEKFLVEETC